ncbi:MAG: PASTA domain-containing protein [Acidobacteriota bacterium]|nr:PASTA domain-containing protein [Acidobacteriota bacterium]
MRLTFDQPPDSPRGGKNAAGERSMPPWLAWLLRWGLRLAYVGALILVCGLTAYTAFSLFVRSGVTRVPPVQGMTLEEATGVVADQGLSLRHEATEDDFDPEVPAGKVLRQTPGARTLVKRGSEIEIALSLGPQVLEVQDLTGQTAQAAQVALAASGLAAGRRLDVYTRDAATGTVVEQNPAPEQEVAPGQPVDLLVSRGSREAVYIMPDLVYRDFEEVRRFFTQRGFRLGSIKYEVYEGISEGVILRQFPLAGHPLHRQDTVSLVVSQTADGTITP